MDNADRSQKFFYANGVEIGMSQFDLNFKFLRQGAAPRPDGKPLRDGESVPYTTFDDLTVAVSPTQAKAMLVGFYKAVRDYEAKFGKIAAEKGTQDNFDSTFGPLIRK